VVRGEGGGGRSAAGRGDYSHRLSRGEADANIGEENGGTEVVSSFRNISMISKYHLDTWFMVQGLGFRVSGFGFRVSDFGFRVSGSGLKI